MCVISKRTTVGSKCVHNREYPRRMPSIGRQYASVLSTYAISPHSYRLYNWLGMALVQRISYYSSPPYFSSKVFDLVGINTTLKHLIITCRKWSRRSPEKLPMAITNLTYLICGERSVFRVRTIHAVWPFVNLGPICLRANLDICCHWSNERYRLWSSSCSCSRQC